jgi:hypothetical protein
MGSPSNAIGSTQAPAQATLSQQQPVGGGQPQQPMGGGKGVGQPQQQMPGGKGQAVPLNATQNNMDRNIANMFSPVSAIPGSNPNSTLSPAEQQANFSQSQQRNSMLQNALGGAKGQAMPGSQQQPAQGQQQPMPGGKGGKGQGQLGQSDLSRMQGMPGGKGGGQMDPRMLMQAHSFGGKGQGQVQGASGGQQSNQPQQPFHNATSNDYNVAGTARGNTPYAPPGTNGGPAAFGMSPGNAGFGFGNGATRVPDTAHLTAGQFNPNTNPSQQRQPQPTSQPMTGLPMYQQNNSQR